jgi:SEC-C motif-containing protein
MKCPCSSGKSFKQCCEPLLLGHKHARTAQQLMRSRYTAYALGGHGEYLLATWWPDSARHLSADGLSESDVQWQSLEVLSKQQKGDEAWVRFQAYCLDQDNELAVMREHSYFKRENGRWFYVSGEFE